MYSDGRSQAVANRPKAAIQCVYKTRGDSDHDQDGSMEKKKVEGCF